MNEQVVDLLSADHYRFWCLFLGMDIGCTKRLWSSSCLVMSLKDLVFQYAKAGDLPELERLVLVMGADPDMKVITWLQRHKFPLFPTIAITND